MQIDINLIKFASPLDQQTEMEELISFPSIAIDSHSDSGAINLISFDDWLNAYSQITLHQIGVTIDNLYDESGTWHDLDPGNLHTAFLHWVLIHKIPIGTFPIHVVCDRPLPFYSPGLGH
jgi:hypothetical protein